MTRTAVAAPPPGGQEPSLEQAVMMLRTLVEDPVARALLKGERVFEIFAPHLRALIKYYDENEHVRLYNEGFATPDDCL
jgi:hypothetical protein